MVLTCTDTEIGPSLPLHNYDQDEDHSHDPGDVSRTTSSTTLNRAGDSPDVQIEGTWGERDVGGPVSHRMAMDDYEQMRRELTRLSLTRSRSKSTSRTGRPSLLRSVTGRTIKSRTGSRAQRTASVVDAETAFEDEDLEAADAVSVAEREEEFELGDFIRDGHFEKRTDAGESAKKVGVVFRNLTVKGIGASASFVKTLPDAVLGEHTQMVASEEDS